MRKFACIASGLHCLSDVVAPRQDSLMQCVGVLECCGTFRRGSALAGAARVSRCMLVTPTWKSFRRRISLMARGRSPSWSSTPPGGESSSHTLVFWNVLPTIHDRVLEVLKMHCLLVLQCNCWTVSLSLHGTHHSVSVKLVDCCLLQRPLPAAGAALGQSRRLAEGRGAHGRRQLRCRLLPVPKARVRIANMHHANMHHSLHSQDEQTGL